MINSILNNKVVLKELVESYAHVVKSCSASKEIKKSFMDNVEDSGFWRLIYCIQKFIQPIADVLLRSEAEDYFIENVYKDFLELK